MRLPAAALACLALAAPAAAGEPISIHAEPIAAFDPGDPERERFGPLRFLGGLELISPDARFGGLSGIDVSADGERILFVTDKANLIAVAPRREDGRLVGVENAVLNRLIDESGAPMYGTVDAEALADPDGGALGPAILVAFERDHRMFRYELGESGASIGIERLELPGEISRLPSNAGIEALAVMQQGTPMAGARIMLAEGELPDRPGLAPGWVSGPQGDFRFWLRREGGFAVTGMAASPDGDLIVLERLYVPLLGTSMALRHVAAEEIAPDAVIEGRRLFTGSKSYQIDNMEGIAARRGADGRTILTLVSDDNFSEFQRTLLLEFALDE